MPARHRLGRRAVCDVRAAAVQPDELRRVEHGPRAAAAGLRAASGDAVRRADRVLPAPRPTAPPAAAVGGPAGSCLRGLLAHPRGEHLDRAQPPAAGRNLAGQRVALLPRRFPAPGPRLRVRRALRGAAAARRERAELFALPLVRHGGNPHRGLRGRLRRHAAHQGRPHAAVCLRHARGPGGHVRGEPRLCRVAPAPRRRHRTRLGGVIGVSHAPVAR